MTENTIISVSRNPGALHSLGPFPGPSKMLKRIRAETIVLFVSLFALGTAFAFQRIRSLDYWWHLRTGALIAESGAVPTADPYTYTVPGAPWIDIHWLFQLGLHGLYRLGGHDAVVVAKVALVWALLGILATIGWRRDAPVVTVFALGSMLLVAFDRFMPRPELPSFVLLGSVKSFPARAPTSPRSVGCGGV